ncbi:MAG: PPK2 family polyphosphate kinase [Bacteroidota bacterium]
MSHSVQLAKIATNPPAHIKKSKILSEMVSLLKQLSEIQEKLYAQHAFSVLIVLQGMDTSGKDSAVKQVFTGVNPAGCNVTSFKAPTAIELDHHFLWRISKECPQKGMIHIFNRSHYEDILVPLVKQTLSEKKIKERCEEINVFEKGLMAEHTIILKFFLHVSQEEQFKRLEERKENPRKQWKFNKEDIIDIDKHHHYAKAYQFIFDHDANLIPWTIIPADKKWFKNYCILNHIVKTLSQYRFSYPQIKSNINRQQ